MCLEWPPECMSPLQYNEVRKQRLGMPDTVASAFLAQPEDLEPVAAWEVVCIARRPSELQWEGGFENKTSSTSYKQ